MAHEAVPPGRGAAAYKPAGAKFKAEGAGEARVNGFYKENGAPMTFGTHDCGSRTVDTNRLVSGPGKINGKTKYCKVRAIATLAVELPHLPVHRPLLATYRVAGTTLEFTTTCVVTLHDIVQVDDQKVEIYCA